ncbi:MAG: IclR family transcriptional regulator [Acidimicrobiia bacterium]|nr:MAG: IclR family transcriptional regulator [Acidimicrobiia bacterium]
MAPESKPQTIAAVERAADVLNVFTELDGATAGVTELSSQLGLSKAVVHRILASLRVKGFVDVDESTRRYSLGPASLALGLTYLQQIDVRDAARSVLRDLSDRTNETATLSVRRGDVRMYVDQVTPPREVKMTVQLGHPYPLHAGGSSKAFLAYLPDTRVDEYLSGPLEALGKNTITDPARLREELAVIRKRGYASSFGERMEGAGSIAAPVFDHENGPVAVISVCGPVERFRDEVDEIAPVLLAATTRLSRRLGWEGP